MVPGSPRTSSCLNNTQGPRGLVPVGDQSVDFLLDAGAALSVLTGARGPLSSQSTAVTGLPGPADTIISAIP